MLTFFFCRFPFIKSEEKRAAEIKHRPNCDKHCRDFKPEQKNLLPLKAKIFERNFNVILCFVILKATKNVFISPVLLLCETGSISDTECSRGCYHRIVAKWKMEKISYILRLIGVRPQWPSTMNLMKRRNIGGLWNDQLKYSSYAQTKIHSNYIVISFNPERLLYTLIQVCGFIPTWF